MLIRHVQYRELGRVHAIHGQQGGIAKASERIVRWGSRGHASHTELSPVEQKTAPRARLSSALAANASLPLLLRTTPYNQKIGV
jgi:hypothetical protein